MRSNILGLGSYVCLGVGGGGGGLQKSEWQCRCLLQVGYYGSGFDLWPISSRWGSRLSGQIDLDLDQVEPGTYC